MDFSRYLPKDSDSKSVFWSATMASSSRAPFSKWPARHWRLSLARAGAHRQPTDQLVKPLPYLLAPFLLLGISIGTVSANVLNIYSGAMSFLALGLKLGGVKQRRRSWRSCSA